MSEGAKVSFQNILLTLKKYDNGRFELLYISSEIRNILTEGEKFYQEDYFEKSFTHSGSGTISSQIDESYVKKLLGYFKRKGAK